jgi:hypothetical protein
MKFVFNVELLPEGMSFDYTQPADGLTKEKNSPLAVALFGFEFVRRVFITNNFITLTKTENAAWEDELFGIKQYLKKYFADNYMTAATDLNPVDAKKVIDNLRERYLPTALVVKKQLDK